MSFATKDELKERFAPQAEGLGAVAMPGKLNYLTHDVDADLSQGASAIKSFATAAKVAAEGLNARRKRVDPEITFAANLSQIERQVDEFEAATNKGLEAARTALAASMAQAQSKLDTLTKVAATQSAPEIRQVLRGLSNQERQDALKKAFDQGDREIIGAVVGSNPIMHGCNLDLVNALYEQFRRKLAHKEYAEVETHAKYQRYLDAAAVDLLAFGLRARKGTEAYARKRDERTAVLASYDYTYED